MVVLPEPMSPVSSENAAWDSRPYSSRLRALACWRDRYRKAGSGVSANGFVVNPKWRSYITAPSIAARRIGSTVQYRADERRIVQQLDRTHEVVAPCTALRRDDQAALDERREGERIVGAQHRRQIEHDDAFGIAGAQLCHEFPAAGAGQHLRGLRQRASRRQYDEPLESLREIHQILDARAAAHDRGRPE